MRKFATVRATGLFLALVFVAPSPARTEDALDLLQDNTDGIVGLYLKRVGGPVRASFNELTIFEPASAVKVAVHLHGMLQVQDPNVPVTLQTVIPWLRDLNKTKNQAGNDCYSNNTEMETDTLEDATQGMMENSHNARTQGLRNFFSDANISSTIQSVDMVDTQLNHSIGCQYFSPGPLGACEAPNQLTLVDVGKLHEDVAMGLLNPSIRQTFYDLMKNSFPSGLKTAIEEEAAKQGKITKAGAFIDLVELARKGGSYGLGCAAQDPGTAGSYRSRAGWVKLPLDHGADSREYVFGAFVDQATTLDAMNTGTPLSMSLVVSELLRLVVRDALLTWKVPGFTTPPGPPGTKRFVAPMDTSQEVPPVITDVTGDPSLDEAATGLPPTGEAIFERQLTSSGRQVQYSLLLEEIQDVLAAHIHCGAEGSNGPVGVTLGLSIRRSGTSEGVFTNPDRDNDCGWDDLAAVVAAMERGGAYVNVTTQAHPDGEIRGQIIPVVGAVAIDVKPTTDVNPINPGSGGVIPVAIHTDDDFDATTVDPSTVHFGRDLAEPMHVGGHIEDVDGDGADDLLFHFPTAETGIAHGDMEVCLGGRTTSGQDIVGCDDVRTVPTCGIGFELAFLLPPLMWLYGRRRLRVR